MKTVLIGNTTCHAAERLQEEFTLKGLSIELVPLNDIAFSVRNGHVVFETVTGNDLHEYDVYMFRGLGDAISEVSVIARYLKSHGKLIVEDVLAARGMYIDKFTPTMVDKHIPTLDYTLVFSAQDALFGGLQYPLIVKGLDSSKGKKVSRVKNKEELIEKAEAFGYPVLVQKYIPITQDYRVIVVGGEALGTVCRYTQGDDFLTIRAGGHPEAVELPQKALDMAVRAAEVAGLTVAGVDMLEHEGAYYRLEVNMSPQFKIFERKTNVNVAEKIVESVVRQYKENNKQA